jgi:hypothetical protein
MSNDSDAIKAILDDIDVVVTYKAGKPVKTSIGTETAAKSIADLLTKARIDEKIKLLDDLSDVGEIHHSVYDYRVEELQSQLNNKDREE